MTQTRASRLTSQSSRGRPLDVPRRTLLRAAAAVAAAAATGWGLTRWLRPDEPPDAATLLRREQVITPRGVHDTEYESASPALDTTFDLRRAVFVSYHDKDAVYETNSFAGGSSEHQKNFRPIHIGHDSPAAGVALVGGVVRGDQPHLLPWIRMKYGQDIQDDTDAWIDAGSPPSMDPYRHIVRNANQDGDPRLYVAPGSWAVVDGLRVHNTHDGLGLYGVHDADGAGVVYVRNCWFREIHDDAIENDEWQELRVNDCLFERVYSLLSLRPSRPELQRARKSRTTQWIEGCTVQLWPFPGGHRQRSTSSNHERAFKVDDNSPRLRVVNTVILASQFISTAAAAVPERITDRGDLVTDVYQGVTIVWQGPGRYPGNVPDGCTVTTNRAVYDDAVADWRRRHGVTSFEDVDVARLLSPVSH